MSNYFILDPQKRTPDRRDQLAHRKIPRALGNLRASAPTFEPSAELVTAVNSALAAGMPLLLTGEPGTGKTQVAYYLQWYFEIQMFDLSVRSTTTWKDLLYEFDTVGYFHAGRDPSSPGTPIEIRNFIKPGPLWRAFETAGPSIVLLDEIDKAARDFPNDLLHVLDQYEFKVKELDDLAITRPPDAPPPVVVITSNSERRLPEPFLRRCIFHHIEFSEALLRRAIEARKKDFTHLDEEAREHALRRFMEIRGRGLRKKPSTGELLVWFTILSSLMEQGQVTASTIKDTARKKLPGLEALVKDRDDLELL